VINFGGGLAAGNYPIFSYGTLVDNILNVGTVPGGFSATVSNDTATSRILLAVTSTGGGDPYSAFATAYGLAAGTGAADPDLDGMSNTNEFLAGFNPNNHNAYVHIISATKSTTNIVVTYLGANGDSTYVGGPASRTNVLEISTGTANGSFSNNYVSAQTNILSGGTGLGTVTSFVDTNGASGVTKYYRVRVLVP
jgi:hypothetical protein